MLDLLARPQSSIGPNWFDHRNVEVFCFLVLVVTFFLPASRGSACTPFHLCVESEKLKKLFSVFCV